MTSLSQQQKEFQDFILGEENQVVGQIKKGRELSAGQSLDIYRHSYHERLAQCLADDFPALCFCMGNNAFTAMVIDYIHGHPSTHYSLDYVGSTLIDFLQKTVDVQPYYSELARFEWLLKQVSLSSNVNVLQADDLSRLTEQQALAKKFCLAPCAQMFESHYNVIQVFETIFHKEQPVVFNYQQNVQIYLLWYHALETHYIELDHRQKELFLILARGASLSKITDSLVQMVGEDEVIEWFPHVFRSWIDRGVLVSMD